MAERRRHKRYGKRYTVRFGEKDLNHSGFTVDVSLEGLFIVSSTLPALDTRLLVQIHTDPAKPPTFLVAVVQRHKVVPPELRTLAKNGFGVRVLKPDELLKGLLPSGTDQSDPRAPMQVVFSTAEEFTRSWEAEIRHGGVFIRTNRTFAADQDVRLQLLLPFANAQLEFSCRVVHIGAGEGGLRGIGVLFGNINAARDALSKFAISKAQ